MRASIARFDEWLMSQTQRAYLWFYDWTGVYVGTISFLMSVLFSVSMWKLYILGFIVLVVRGITDVVIYRMQSTGKLKMFNECSRRWQSSGIRWFTNSSFAVFIVIDTLRPDLRMLFGDACIILSSYLLTVQIREREPREFWRLAPQGAGS